MPDVRVHQCALRGVGGFDRSLPEHPRRVTSSIVHVVIEVHASSASVVLRLESADPLRADVVQTANAIRQMLGSGQLPPPLAAEQAARRCKACSLQERCQPHATHANLVAARRALFDPDL